MENNKIVLTYQSIFFGGQTLGKLLHNAANDKHGYWINKLFRKIDKLQKQRGPAAQKFLEDLANEYADKDEKGNPIINQGVAQVSAAKREEYETKREEFLDTKVELDFDKLPIEYFAHIQKTPMDWDLIGQISNASPQVLDAQESAKNHAHEALRAIQGGQQA